MKRILSLFCAVCILVTGLSLNFTVSAAKKDEKVAKSDDEIIALEKEMAIKGTYSYFLANEAFEEVAGDELVLNAAKAKKGTDKEKRGYMEWNVKAAVSTRYYIQVTYKVTDTTRDDVERRITVNGKIPYEELETVIFEREFFDVSEPDKDYYGNEIRVASEEKREFITNYLYDFSYYYAEPLSINLEAGEKTKFRITDLECDAEIKSVKLIPVGNVKSYAEWIKENESLGIAKKENSFSHQAERFSGKSTSMVYPISDRTSPVTEPQTIGKITLNTVGGYHWNILGQYVKWTVNAPESGLYKITLRARQNAAPGQTVSRTISVNNVIPFKEAMEVSFVFDNSWQVVTIGGKEEYYFYLNKGENEIKLQNTLGRMDNVLRVIDTTISEFNRIYRKMLPMLGASPDLLRDYRLDVFFPEEIELLNKYARVLETCAEWLEFYGGEGNSGAAIIRSFVRQLDVMYEDPDEIPSEYSYFKSNVGSLSTWLADAKELPLEIDSFVFGNDEEAKPKKKANFFKQLVFDVGEYFNSYIIDYSLVGTKEKRTDDDAIVVWVSAGREHAQIISNLTVKEFTAETGIPVAIKNVAANLMTATVAGIGPDLVIRSSADVFNYAMRNAAYPISDLPGFDEVASRFDAASMIGMKYLDKYYGLPESIDYEMLFYRTDIFEEENLEVPQTWDELVSISSILANKNMEIAMSTQPDSYLYLLKQHGYEVYGDNDKVCILDEIGAIEVFDMFTNFFVSYGFPLSYNFVNRFRTGEMPIGIANYSTYNSLVISAPEINGLWEMTLLPGTEREDGTLNRMATVAISATMMLASAADPSKAPEDDEHLQNVWKYMKWWLEAEQQITYADEIESVLGPSARYNSANIEAFKSSNWTREQRNLINAQRQHLTAIQPVPGGYYLNRNITNAFRQVVYNGMSPTDALFEYTHKINAEIDKKRREFGLEVRAEAKQ